MTAPGRRPRFTTTRGHRTVGYELVEGGVARLILLAGTSLPGAYWTLAQTGAFSTWATCLLVDNAGTGATEPLPDGHWSTDEMALDVVAILDRVGWPTAHVVGHSLGSAIAVSLARAHTERVDSLSLHSTWPSADRAPHVVAWLQARQATAGTSDTSLWMRYAFFLVSPRHFADHGFDSGALGSVAALIAAVGRGAHVGQYEAGIGHDGYDHLASIEVPTLVTVGSDDFVTLPEYGRAVADLVPGAVFSEFPGAGHMAALERADQFNTRQRLFIESISKEERS